MNHTLHLIAHIDSIIAISILWIFVLLPAGVQTQEIDNQDFPQDRQGWSKNTSSQGFPREINKETFTAV
ncbi:MAG: hypothetical protein V4480_02095 [Patescibacteria group bacterium]